jgi:chorismate mutase
MAGEHDKLRESLDQLQAQLDAMRQRDPAMGAQLDSLIGQAKTALGGPPLQPAEHRSIVKRLSDAVEKYEASHPSLAGNLGSIIDALSQMGI